MELISKTVFFLSIFLTIVAGGLVMIKDTNSQMAQYEIQHNCKFDNNGFCYTESERPWLF